MFPIYIKLETWLSSAILSDSFRKFMKRRSSLTNLKFFFSRERALLVGKFEDLIVKEIVTRCLIDVKFEILFSLLLFYIVNGETFILFLNSFVLYAIIYVVL